MHVAGSHGAISENVVATLVAPYFDGQEVELLMERGTSKDLQSVLCQEADRLES